MKRNYFILVFLLLLMPSCNEIRKEVKDNVDRIERGYTEDDLKSELEGYMRSKLPLRKSDDIVLKEASYDNKIWTLYYIFEEEGGIYDMRGVINVIRDGFLKECSNLPQEAVDMFKQNGIKCRLVVKGDGSGKMADSYVTAREIEDAIRYK